MSELEDELIQASDVVAYLKDHPQVVPQSVSVSAGNHDFTSLVINVSLRRVPTEGDE